MAQITITINSREYAIACEDGQELHIMQLSRMLDEKAKLQYYYEMQRLKNFVEKWQTYFDDLQEKYPLYSSVKQAVDIKDKVLKGQEKEARKTILEIDEILSKQKERFNPKKKIDEYIAATTTSTNGFNLDDVLNPGELQLEDL